MSASITAGQGWAPLVLLGTLGIRFGAWVERATNPAMRLALSITAALFLFTLAASQAQDVSLWLAVAIAALVLGGVAVNRPSTS